MSIDILRSMKTTGIYKIYFINRVWNNVWKQIIIVRIYLYCVDVINIFQCFDKRYFPMYVAYIIDVANQMVEQNG